MGGFYVYAKAAYTYSSTFGFVTTNVSKKFIGLKVCMRGAS